MACVQNIGYVEAKTCGVGVLFDPHDQKARDDNFAWAEKKSAVCNMLPTIVPVDIQSNGVGGNTPMMFMRAVAQGCLCVVEELYQQFAVSDGKLGFGILEKLSLAFAAGMRKGIPYIMLQHSVRRKNRPR